LARCDYIQPFIDPHVIAPDEDDQSLCSMDTPRVGYPYIEDSEEEFSSSVDAIA
jgi:hypothetical protein